MEDKHPESVPALLASLKHLRATNPKAVRSNVHLYPAEIYTDNGEGSSTGHERDRRITSWKMTEHMYLNPNNPFPTLARGLFTEEVEEGDPLPEEVIKVEGKTLKERIVARGYDKFFNIGETAWTNWDSMQKHTESPYYLTLKSNGCLILISALSPSHLMVASKHSLGTTTEPQPQPDRPSEKLADEPEQNRPDQADGKGKEGKKGKKAQKQTEREEVKEEKEDMAHAEVGRSWVKKTLQRKGKTEAQLARRLWDGNMSAVLELCDDSFEEHVIATPDYWTGLHLHGLNHNTPHFSTLSPEAVTAFAEEFAFITTKSVRLNTLDEVRAFTDDVAKTGSWEGDMIEGFVVRSTVRSTSDPDSTDRPPYKPGSPFFFKVKFDEPYLLYRQWREMTRVMLPLLDKDITVEQRREVWQKVKRRIKRAEVALYADWVGRTIESNPALFDDYNRGIVKVRDRFLRWTDEEGKEEWTAAQGGTYKLKGWVDPAISETNRKGNKKQEAPRDITKLPKKYVLVPIAVPGCGKTLVGLVLARLFGFGHTQSDDVTAKRTAPTFLKNITEMLKKHEVVYADRNNHIEKHYKELADLHNAKDLKSYNVRLIAILWDIDSQPYHRLIRICSERVVTRGDNHQTLRPDLTLDAEHEAVVGSFLRNFETPDEGIFDDMIDVSVMDSPLEAIKKVITGLQGSDLESPPDEQIQAALDGARGYQVTTPYHPPNKLGRSVRYFGLAPEIDPAAIVEIAVYHMPPHHAQSAQRFLSDLISKQRVITSPHITLVHETNVQAEKESQPAPGIQQRAWEICVRLAEKQVNAMWSFNMTHLVWDNRVMALVVDDLVPTSQEGQDDLQHLVHEETKEGIHITVGTKEEEIRPYEARALVEMVRQRINQGEDEGEVEGIVAGGGEVRWAKIGSIHGEGRVKGMW